MAFPRGWASKGLSVTLGEPRMPKERRLSKSEFYAAADFQGLGTGQRARKWAERRYAEQEKAVREHHVSGGMFKSPEESHHHPDSMTGKQLLDTVHARLGGQPGPARMGLGKGPAMQTGPRGGKFYYAPGGGKVYVRD